MPLLSLDGVLGVSFSTGEDSILSCTGVLNLSLGLGDNAAISS